MMERDLTDIVRERKELRPGEWRTITHSCGHEAEWYVFNSKGAGDLTVEAVWPCPLCRPCSLCQGEPCICADPFDEEAG